MISKNDLLNNNPVHPIDLLPIKRPLEDSDYPDETYFYQNVVCKLIPDIIRMETNGIPINLSKVSGVEETVNSALENVYTQIAASPLMLKHLEAENKAKCAAKAQVLETKKKTIEDFLVVYNSKNKVHRAYVVNYYLTSIDKTDMCMDEWSVKDLKKLNQIISSKFLQDLIDNNIQSYMESTINAAMQKLAQDKAEAYNKNKIESKIEAVKSEKLIKSFNPGSSLQKAKFFAFYGVESENETAAGNAKWDRKEIERLLKLLNNLIEEKE